MVTVTQAIVSDSGNTAITLTDTGTAGMSKTDFTGGVTAGGSTISKQMWELAGDSSDTNIQYDINLAVTTAAATGAAGTISFVILYTNA